MATYVIKVKRGSTDEMRLEKYLVNSNIHFETRPGVFETNYIEVDIEKAAWKQMKANLDLTVTTRYCDFKGIKG